MAASVPAARPPWRGWGLGAWLCRGLVRPCLVPAGWVLLAVQAQCQGSGDGRAGAQAPSSTRWAGPLVATRPAPRALGLSRDSLCSHAPTTTSLYCRETQRKSVCGRLTVTSWSRPLAGTQVAEEVARASASHALQGQNPHSALPAFAPPGGGVQGQMSGLGRWAVDTPVSLCRPPSLAPASFLPSRSAYPPQRPCHGKAFGAETGSHWVGARPKAGR